MSRRFWADLAERAVTTYACTFTGLLMTGDGHWHSMTHAQAAAWAALPMGLEMLKGLLGKRVGDPQSAGFLPAPKVKEPAGGGN